MAPIVRVFTGPTWLPFEKTSMVSDILFAILVVGDDGNVARIPWLSLRRTRSGTTGDGESKVLEQQPSDPAIQELQVPNGEGGAILDWLRQVNERTGSPPVWLVTSARGAEEATGLGDSRRRHSLAMPFEPWDLIAMLEDLLLAKDGPH
jgi:response regulator RpfG family c-di-GMP phosphodiesterase